MQDKREMTMLCFKEDTQEVWSGVPGVTPKIFEEFLEEKSYPEAIGINGHSVEGCTIEDKSAKEIAKELATKYGAEKHRLKDVCLLACEATITSNDEDEEELSFAQSLANELVLAGFRNVSVHAPPPVPKDHRSRLTVDKNLTSQGSAVRYYQIKKSEIEAFDTEFEKNNKVDRKWNNESGYIRIPTAIPNTFFIDSFKDATQTYSPQNAIARGIEAEIDGFFATVIKELYILFENLGSSLKQERTDFESSYNALQQTYNDLIELDTQRDNYGKNLKYSNKKFISSVKDTVKGAADMAMEGVDKGSGAVLGGISSTSRMLKNFFFGSTANPPIETPKPEAQQTPAEPQVENFGPEKTLKRFFQTSLVEQFTYDTNKNPVFKHTLPNSEKVDYLNAKYGSNNDKNATGKELREFMDTYQRKLGNYASQLQTLHTKVQELKASLLEAVNKYLDENPGLIDAKKNVINALKDYLNEKNLSEIPKKQQALLKAIQENPGWSAGLFSKRSRTAVESAIDLIKVEEEYQTFRPK